MADEDVLHTHHCRGTNSTLQESFFALSPRACLYFIILLFVSERQHGKVKKAKDTLALDTAKEICCDGVLEYLSAHVLEPM